MPLGSVAACSLPNHRDRVLHFTAHTHCVIDVYVYITHTCMSIAPPQTYSIRGRAMQRRNGQETAAMPRGGVGPHYLSLSFVFSYFYIFVFCIFCTGFRVILSIDSCLAIARECSSLAVFSYLHFVSFL